MQNNRIDELIARVGGCALSNRGTLVASYQIARDAIEAGVEGDFVECGVFAGSQAAMMAFALMDSISRVHSAALLSLSPRYVHLFDTFSGIPAGGPEDLGWTHQAGTSACSIERVQKNLTMWGIPPALIRYHHGLVEDTVPPFAAGGPTRTKPKIAVLRVDVDLYGPTKIVMDNLAPLVSQDGWIIFDDFHLPGARKAIEPHLNSEVMYLKKTYSVS